jgi:hypothetical protein
VEPDGSLLHSPVKRKKLQSRAVKERSGKKQVEVKGIKALKTRIRGSLLSSSSEEESELAAVPSRKAQPPARTRTWRGEDYGDL